jgi:hypothetical protein
MEQRYDRGRCRRVGTGFSCVNREDNMANLGDSLNVGEATEIKGRYKHMASGCWNTVVLEKGAKVPECDLDKCSNKEANWTLQAILPE